MPKMMSVTIGGLSENANLRLIEILEAGLTARAQTQTKARIEADRKLVDYITVKLKFAGIGSNPDSTS